jgi:hypothetical protein
MRLSDEVHQDGELLTTTQVGALLNRSGRTIARWAQADLIPYTVKLPGPNGHFLFRRSDIETFLDSKGAAS